MFHAQEGGESTRERAGAMMAEGGSLVSSLGGQGDVAGVEVMVPSLAGSSELSSGVISGFRRALVWADGGEAAAAAVCPSVVSSLNGIPGRGAESADAYSDSDTGGEHADWSRNLPGEGNRDNHPMPAQGLHREGIGDNNGNDRDDDYAFSSIGGGDDADGRFGNAGGTHGTLSRGGGGRVTRHDPEVKGVGAPGGDGYKLHGRLKESLTWRWPSMCSTVDARGTNDALSPQKPPKGSYLRQRGTTDFRDFFDNEEEMAARQQQPKAYAHLGGLREEGQAKYVFDRTSHTRKGSLAAHLRGDYEPRPKGYRGTNVHSVADWRRLNTTLDRYAITGREAMERVAKSDRDLRNQGVWVRQHTKAREQRRQRANHLLEVYRSELLKEQLREIEALHLAPGEQHAHATKNMKDQILAADRIMRTVVRYGLVGNMEDAHYVKYAADAAQRAGLASTNGAAAAKMKAGGGGGAGVVKASSKKCAIVATKKRAGSKHGAGDDTGEQMSPYSAALARALPAGVAPVTERRAGQLKTAKPPVNTGRFALGEGQGTASAAAEQARRSLIQSERLRTFSLAGHPLRRGVEHDTTAVPALISIPEGFGHANGQHKSFVAGRIIEALRASQVDAITGRQKRIAVPLWHRATDDMDSSGAGSVLYSDLIGHTYSVLVGPKRGVVGRRQGTG
ncbi:unnamed protein product [Ectocarpus sp. 4 AP-2014]